MRKLEYVGANRIEGPLLFVEGIRDVAFDEVVEIKGADGEERLGRVLEVGRGFAAIQVFEGTSGLSPETARMRFVGRPLEIPVSRRMLGRTFDGLGRPIDGGPPPLTKERRDVNGLPINPFARDYPRDFIQTGISAIDGMNTLVRGQKLPIFSGSGLPHNSIAAQITRQAKLLTEKVEFTVVFAAMGVKYDIARFFINNFEETGVLENVALFLSLANDPSIERLITPRSALTLAEHLAFECDMHVLVILTDMTNYCESLREIATARGEIPSRKGYPGYLYSDLASIYERAGRVLGKKGSITQVPILTMPSDDISHPVPDLTGYITEGQIVLERELFQRSIYPPIAGLPSLSRLMKDGIGKDRTRPDHPHLASQLFAAYKTVKDVRSLASVIGEEELSSLDRKYMQFGARLENEFLRQGDHEDRSIEQTLEIGWKVLTELPQSELHRVTEEELETYYHAKKSGEGEGGSRWPS
ncbi:MAG: V-type ATP synthase subunit B [Planctomycetes bacterium]|nr:V-type ATP synthase subunit B [Planctomycetota bacterium]